MLKLTRTGIGLLTRQYRSVLKKCFLINAGLFFALAPSAADATAPIVVNDGEVIEKVEGTFNTPGSSGAAILILGGSPGGRIDLITNSVFENISGGYGASIMNGARINSITNTVFRNNTSSGQTAGIYTTSYLGTLAADFIDNTAYTAGVAVQNWHARIDTITGNYIRNIGTGDGGAIFNGGVGASIGTINANFDSNLVKSGDTVNYGGAIYTYMPITSIYGTFTNNGTEGLSTANAAGGAIYNIDSITNIGSADNKVTFTGNYAQSNSDMAQGGAIFNAGNIGTIYADFKNNKTTSGANGSTGHVNAQGGAIYNTGTIGRIVGDFIGNKTINTVSRPDYNDGGAIYNTSTGNITITGNFYDNSTCYAGGAILNYGLVNLIADDSHNVIFRNNISTYTYDGFYYNDIDNRGTLNLNAHTNQKIDFGGAIIAENSHSTRGTLNIGNGYAGAATGGYYTFHNGVEDQYMNLYNGADVRLRGMYQENESYTTGILKNTTTTITGTGNIISSIDNNANSGANDTQYHQSNDLGALSFNSEANLILRFDINANGSGDLFTASSVTGASANSIIVDRIRVYDNTTQQSVNIRFVDANLKDYINLATNVVEDTYYKDIYTVTYSKGTDGGYVTLTKNSNPHYNLVGFLSQDATGTSYTLDSDEYVYRNISSMTGSSKIVNAGNYTIYGGNNKGFIVGANKSLTINGGVWDGFSDSDGGVLGTEVDSTLEITNAIFRNNITTGYDIDGVVLLLGGTTTKLYADFINNHGIPTAGEHASAWGGVIKNSGTINSLKGNYISNYILASGTDDQYDAEGGAIANFSLIKEIINSSFTDNSAIHTASEHAAKGGAIANRSVIETIIDSSFADNYVQAPSYMGLGGAIYNAFQIGKFDTDGTPIANTGIINAIFEGNNADKGGAIYNDTGGYLIISDSNFNKNIAQTKGGAIYNGGTMYIYATTADVLFSENYTPLSNVNAAGILNAGDLTLDAQNGKKIIFEGNYGEGDTDGIAISNSSGANLSILGNVIFRNNYNVGEGNGGQLVGVALLNQGHIYSIGSVNNQALFENNHSSSENTRKAEGILANQGLAVIDNMYAEFKDNYLMSTDQALGGAIYNDSTITNIQNSTFSGNYVSGNDDSKGGAIYNEGSIGFSGTNTFTNNKANEVPNDIYNAGTININGGTTTLNSGYIGSETSALTVKSGGTLTANAALEVADGGTLTNESGGTLAVSADNLKIDETTNNGTLELEGGNVTTKLMGTGRMKLMSGNVRLLSSTPPATTGSLSFGSSSDYADSILTSSSAASTSDHALVTAGYLDNNYYMNYGDSMAKSFIKAANDNNFTTLNCVKEA